MTSGGGIGGEADVLYVEIRAQANEQSLRQMEQQVEQAGTAAGQKGGAGLKGAFGELLGGLPGLAVTAAAAVGAALVGGAKAAVDFAQQARQGVKEIGAELGLTSQEAEALGEVAKRVFGNNWGGSLAEAQQAVANVRREVQGLTDGELQAVAEGSLAIAQRFEEDQSKVAAAVQSVMRATGMGAQEALDFITAGFQRGLNSSGDFLDTLNEYGPQFEKAKTTGSELFSLLETGAAKGALGTDKVADAFKEFGFSIADTSKPMVAAFGQLGIKQDELQAKINSGQMTQTQAFQFVIDKLKGVRSETERMAIISQIFKGAGEDLGKVAVNIDTTKTKMGELGGSTNQVKDSFNTFGSVFQTAWREVLIQLQPVGDLLLDLANDAMPSVKAALAQAGPYVTQFVRFLVEGFHQGREAAGQFAPYIERAGGVVQALGPLFASVFGLLKTLWETVLRPSVQAILPTVSTVFSGVADVTKSTIQTITHILNALAALLRGDWSAAWDHLKQAAWASFGGLEDALDKMVPRLLEQGKNLGLKLVEGFQGGIAGFQAMILNAIANAIDAVKERLPGWMQGLAGSAADAARAAAGQAAQSAAAHNATAANVWNGAGQFGNVGQILAALGISGVRQTQGYGVNAGAHGYGARGHTGLDYGTPQGTNIYAPTGARVTYGNDPGGYGQYLKLIDAQGKQMILAHLSGIGTALLNEIKQGGGWGTVNAGEFLGKTGGMKGLASSGNSTGPHLHIELRDASGKVINPGGNVAVPQPAPTPTGGAGGATTNTTSGSTTLPPATVPLPTAAEQKAYSLSLKDWNTYSREALAIARQLKEADVSKDEGFVLRVRARATAFKEAGDAQAASLAFASERLSQTAKKEEETDLQRDQRLRREQQTRVALEKSIRAAGEERLNQIIRLGVTETNSLEKINLAEKELERRGQLSAQAAKDAAAAREKADKEAEASAKTSAANRLAAERALTDGQITLAKGKAQQVISQYDREMRAAGDSAEGKLAVEERLGRDALAARDTIARADAQAEVQRLERERNQAVNVQGLTLRQRQDLWGQYAKRIAQVNTALTGTIEDNAAASTRSLLDLQVAAGRTASELVDQELSRIQERFQDVQAQTARAYQMSYGFGEDGLVNALAATARMSTAQVRSDVEGALAEARRLAPDAAAIIERVYADALAAQRTAAQGQRDFFQSLKPGKFEDFTLPGGNGYNLPNSQNMALPGVVPFNWNSDVGRTLMQQDQAAAAKRLAEELGRLSDTDLETARTAAILADDNIRLTGIITEQTRRVQDRAQAQRDFYQTLKPGRFEDFSLPGGNGANFPNSQNMRLPGVPDAQNYFQQWSQDLWKMGDALKDPLRLDAVVKDLEAAHAAGKLTNSELQVLKSIISSINAEPLELFQTEDERRFEGVVQQFDKLTSSFDAGEMSLEEFASQAGPLSDKMERMALAAEKNNNPQLAAYYRDLAAGLRNMLPVLDGSTAKLAQQQQGFDKLKNQIQQVGAVVQKTFALFGADSEVVQGIGQLTNAAVSGVEAFAKFSSGDIVGGIMATLDAVMNLGQAIDNLDPGIRAWKKSLLEVADAEKKVAQSQVGMFKNVYSEALKQDAAAREKLANSNFFTRLWWGLTGTGPQVMSDAAAKLQITAAEIFGELGQSLSNLIDSSLMNAFEMGDWSGVEGAFEKSMNSLVARMALKAIIVSSGLEEKIKAYADSRAKALEDNVISPTEQADLDRMMAGIRQGYRGITDTWQQVAPTLPGYGQGKDAAPAGSIAALQQQISDLQSKLNLATSDSERDALRGQIQALQSQLDAMSGKEAAGTSAADTSLTRTVDVKLPTITTSIDFDVFSTLPSVIERAAPRIEQGGQAIVEGAGRWLAGLDRLERLLTHMEMKPDGSFK